MKRKLVELLSCFLSRVPEGYEDETGFHYGVSANPAASSACPRQATCLWKDDCRGYDSGKGCALNALAA